MERQYTRIDLVRNILDDKLKKIPNEEIKRCAYVHLYGVGQAAAFLSIKRGLGRKTAELAEIAGMLHDITKYLEDEERDHAHTSAEYSRDILRGISQITEDEAELIYRAIYSHSDKHVEGAIFEEVLKDADELQHYFRNPMEDYWLSKERVRRLLDEFGVGDMTE